jgi:3-deoxy-D-manno-octulosonic-acid transferase
LKAQGAGLRFLVAGSTLEGEESALLEAWPRLLEADPKLVMVLAPRHPERFAAVAGLLKKSGLKWGRRSDWRGDWRGDGRAAESHSAPEGSPRPVLLGQIGLGQIEPGQIVLLDTIGELASVYSLAAVAFVGGSLVPAGGHNPLEPAQFGVPIVMGKHYANFRAITELLIERDAVRIVELSGLTEALIELLSGGTGQMGARALEVFKSQAGATERTVEAIKNLLAGNVPAGNRFGGSSK